MKDTISKIALFTHPEALALIPLLTKASDTGISVVLQQHTGDSQKLLAFFFSNSCSP